MGKLYRISFDGGGVSDGGDKLMAGLVVFRKLPTIGESMSSWWESIGGVVMWLGTKRLPTGWGSLLHEGTVYYVWLEHQGNLKRLQRVNLP